MQGEERRKEILTVIGGQTVSGSALAARLGVSRQVIVQDIALLRMAGYQILSTSRGYTMTGSSRCQREFYVSHSDDRIEEELNLIVDEGGTVEDVFVRHITYGVLRAELQLSSRKQVRAFLSALEQGSGGPLKKLTGDRHYHTVSAASQDILDSIGEQLKIRGFLASDSEE